MDRQKITDKVSRETSYAKWEVNLLMNSILNAILDSLEQGTDVSLKKFGKFELKTQKARKVHYPNNNVTISVPEKVKVIFNVHRCFKVEDEILEKTKNKPDSGMQSSDPQ